MYPLIFPLEPNLQVLINGQRLGMLQSYQVVSKREVSPITGFGSSEIATIFPGAQTYHATLHRLVLDFNNLLDQIRPYELENFALTIQDDRQELYFTGCQWTSITEGYSLGESVTEELQLVAKSCTRTAMT